MNDILTIGSEIKQRILSEIGNSNQCIFVAMYPTVQPLFG